ncbi:hypothetical protein BGZ63DRAFT_465611 [Mariannaea sp. PMI_226]|nr:hypothetical protein BGZ63DRAFT_465611 [Mariannaea sp. PMI_226]
MKSVAALLITTVAVSAQLNTKGNVYTCAEPNQSYCVGDSLKTNIIVRCDANGKGTAGNCAANLAGQPPLGGSALCYQSSANAGDAACAKNCVVYGNDGTGSTLPASVCTSNPSVVSVSIQSAASTHAATLARATSTTAAIVPSTSQETTTSSTTASASSTSGSENPSSANSTPKSPSTSATSGAVPIPTSGAAAHKVGGGLAAIGLIAAYLL